VTSSLTVGPVATSLSSIFLPDALIAALAPSRRGWMLSCPGVAMKPTTGPSHRVHLDCSSVLRIGHARRQRIEVAGIVEDVIEVVAALFGLRIFELLVIGVDVFADRVRRDEPEIGAGHVDQDTVHEPDALVYCGEKLPGSAVEAPNPIIVVEVLSASTRHIDASAKLAGYFRIASVSH